MKEKDQLDTEVRNSVQKKQDDVIRRHQVAQRITDEKSKRRKNTTYKQRTPAQTK